MRDDPGRRSQGQKEGDSGRMKEGERREGARSSPPISPNDLGQPGRGADAGPDAARAAEPRHVVGARGRESRPESRVCGLRAEAALQGQAGGGALSAVLKPRRTGGRGALRGARTSGQAGAPGTLSPETPRSLTLPSAEQKRQDSGGAHGEAGRRAAGSLGPGTAGTRARGGWTGGAGRATAALARGRGAASLGASVCRSAHQALCTGFEYCSCSGSARAPCLYTPDPGNDVIVPVPAPFPHPSGGPAAARSTPSLTRLASSPRHSQFVGQATKRAFGTGNSADLSPLDCSTDLLCVGGQVTSCLWASCASNTR